MKTWLRFTLCLILCLACVETLISGNPAGFPIRTSSGRAMSKTETRADKKYVSGKKKTKSTETKTPQTKGYHVLKKKRGRFLVDEKGKSVTGWFIKIHSEYQKLGGIEDLGIYKTRKFKILFAGKNGKIAADTTHGGFTFTGKGYLSSVTGLFQIRKHFYFIKEGCLVAQDTKYKKAKYFVRLDGTVSGIKKGKKMYKPSGQKMSDIERRDIRARLYAKEIICDITKKTMSKDEKLQTCFQWVVHNYNYVEVECNGEEGWTSRSGITMLQKGIGDCRTLAVGFAYLASELGYDDACLCQDSRNKFSGAHCWTNVDGKYYDPLFYNTKKPEKYLSVFNGSTPEAYLRKTHCSASQTFKPGA